MTEKPFLKKVNEISGEKNKQTIISYSTEQRRRCCLVVKLLVVSSACSSFLRIKQTPQSLMAGNRKCPFLVALPQK